MKDKRKIGIIVTIVVMLLTVFGVTYAFVNFTLNGQENSVLVTGDIYMNYTETNQINLTDAVPMTKEDALKLNNNIFKFTISGKNQSKKDIYYGISIVYGEEQASKTRLKDEDIDVYLTSGEDVLVNANRYKSLEDTRIWAEKIGANTENYTKDYSLRMWIDEGVTIGNQDVDYTQDIWNNSYASYKVKVDGNLNEMNVPLEVDYQNTYYENGKTYFIVNISNYLNPSEKGIRLASSDTMKLDITTSNKDVVFSYQDDAGNKSEDGQSLSNISQTYTFEENKKIKMQVYVTSKNDIDLKTDINIKLSKNDTENYEILKYMHIKGAKDYCKNNGFSNFADCLLVSEQLSNTVAEAKEGIISKGAPTLSKTAPEITYVATEEKTGAEVPQNTAYFFAYADSVTFDTKAGNYTLTGNVKTSQKFNETMQGKWTCGSSGVTVMEKCETVYHIISVEGNTLKTATSRTYQIANAVGSEVGLYKTEDNNGDTYFYRGDVQNNNVKFAGFYWKIIRVNGDGSIRLIYNGTKPNSTDLDASSITGAGVKYNLNPSDPTYVGYMYGDNFSETPIKSKTTSLYGDIQANTKIYFAKAYTSDNVTKTFKLTNADYFGTFSEWNAAGKLAEGYKYTCKSAIADGTCQFLMEITKYNSSTLVDTYFWTYSSTSYEATREDTASSNAKIELENWYKTKLAIATEGGQTADKYIETNATFCNDRSLSTGDGFSIAPSTYYKAYNRNQTNKAASLVCPNIADLFSVSSTSKGNGKLSSPIGLITVDEVTLAGGLYQTKNERYYLYTGRHYWTMSPYYFYSWIVYANLFDIRQNGDIGSDFVAWATPGLRAVINLKKEVLLNGGNGTMEDPYTVKLAN